MREITLNGIRISVNHECGDETINQSTANQLLSAAKSSEVDLFCHDNLSYLELDSNPPTSSHKFIMHASDCLFFQSIDQTHSMRFSLSINKCMMFFNVANPSLMHVNHNTFLRSQRLMQVASFDENWSLHASIDKSNINLVCIKSFTVSETSDIQSSWWNVDDSDDECEIDTESSSSSHLINSASTSSTLGSFVQPDNHGAAHFHICISTLTDRAYLMLSSDQRCLPLEFPAVCFTYIEIKQSVAVDDLISVFRSVNLDPDQAHSIVVQCARVYRSIHPIITVKQSSESRSFDGYFCDLSSNRSLQLCPEVGKALALADAAVFQLSIIDPHIEVLLNDPSMKSKVLDAMLAHIDPVQREDAKRFISFRGPSRFVYYGAHELC